MHQLKWFALQIACVAFCMYALADVASEKGTEFHSGQAFVIGMMLAFLVTIICKIVVGQYRYWFTADQTGAR